MSDMGICRQLSTSSQQVGFAGFPLLEDVPKETPRHES
jgi:hypothetical protein